MFNMFSGLLKSKVKDDGKISISTAAAFVIQANIDDLKENWPSMKNEIFNYEDAFGWINESWVRYEFMLAAMGADTLALYNLFPKEQADKLFKELLKILNESEDVGKLSVDAVSDYYSVAVEAVNATENPLEYVVSLILHRLEVPDSESGTITMMGMMSAIGQMVGNWKWLNTKFSVAAN